MALSKKTNDISYINPQTGEVECTFNECRLKFKPGYCTNSASPKWSENSGKRRTFEFVEYFHECNECGRRQRGNTDRTLSIRSYEASISGHKLNDLLNEAAADGKRFRSVLK